MKKVSGFSLAKRKKYFYYFTLIFASLLLVTQYQNCSPGNGNGLKIGGDCVGNSCNYASSQCTSTYCGGFADFIYWNGCEPHVLGWAWSDNAAANKLVGVNMSNGTSTSCNTGILRPDVNAAPLTPPVPSAYSGFDCKLNSTTFSSLDYSLTSASVQGAGQAFVVPPVVKSITPQECNGSQMKLFNNACTVGTYPAFGWIDTTTDYNATSCNLTVRGWGWSEGGQSGTKLAILLSDGTNTDGPKVSIGRSNAAVKGVFPCVDDNPGFEHTFAAQKFAASALVSGKATITVYVYGPTGMQALNPYRVSVPSSCLK